MPRQHSLCHTPCARKRKNAFEISGPIGLNCFFRFFFVVLVACVDHFEKVSRRKLFVIADHDDLVGPRDNSKCILGRNLTCFVDHQNAEVKSTRREKLSYGKRAHKENRL